MARLTKCIVLALLLRDAAAQVSISASLSANASTIVGGSTTPLVVTITGTGTFGGDPSTGGSYLNLWPAEVTSPQTGYPPSFGGRLACSGHGGAQPVLTFYCYHDVVSQPTTLTIGIFYLAWNNDTWYVNYPTWCQPTQPLSCQEMLYSSMATISVTVLPPSATLTVDPNVVGGNTLNGTLTFNQPLNGVTVYYPNAVWNNYTLQVGLSSDVPAVHNLGFNLPSGASSVPISMNTDPVARDTPATISTGFYPSLPLQATATTTVTTLDDEAGLGPCCGQSSAAGGQPINFSNGNTYIQQTDVSLPGLGGGLRLDRTWNSRWPQSQAPSRIGMFGPNWRSTYEEMILVSGGIAKYSRNDGSFWTFSTSGTPQLTAPADGGATLTSNTNSWTLKYKNGETRVFSNTGSLMSISDRNGNTTQLSYDSQNRLVTVTDAAGRHLYFAYSNATFPAQVTGVSSDAGLSLSYTYDTQGRLASYTKQDGQSTSFTYDANSLITAVLDSQGKVLESHTYDSSGKGLTSSRAGGVDAITVTYP